MCFSILSFYLMTQGCVIFSQLQWPCLNLSCFGFLCFSFIWLFICFEQSLRGKGQKVVLGLYVIVQWLSHVWLFGSPCMPHSPVFHYLPEFAQIHVHWVGDAIESSHPLPHSSPLAFHLYQHGGLFQWVSS